AFQVIAVNLQPVGRGRMGSGIARSQDSRIILALLADFHYGVRPDIKRRDVYLAAIHHNVSVANQLPCLTAAGSESHAVHDAIETPLEGAQQSFAGDALLSGSLLKQVAELAFQQSVITARFLLFA